MLAGWRCWGPSSTSRSRDATSSRVRAWCRSWAPRTAPARARLGARGVRQDHPAQPVALDRPPGGRRRVAWLSLDEADNDPRRFLEHVVAALQGVGDVGRGRRSSMADRGSRCRPSGADQPGQRARPGQRAGSSWPWTTTTSSRRAEVHRAVGFLLDHLPPRVILAVATRADPPLPLPRLRARGELVELRAADLRFTAAESRRLPRRRDGARPQPDQVAALEARTEGWAAGLQLAGLSLRGVDDTAGFVDAFTGSHRFVLDYLVEEVLSHQPEAVRALPARHRGPEPADRPAVRRAHRRPRRQRDARSRSTARTCSSSRSTTAGSGTATTTCSRDALRARLLAEQPDRVPGLHRAASDWYAAHGPTRGRRAPRDGRRRLRSAPPTSSRRALPDLRRERRDRLLREWLTGLPADVVRSRPLLGTYLAWTRLVLGDLDGVETALGDAERALGERPCRPPGRARRPPPWRSCARSRRRWRSSGPRRRRPAATPTPPRRHARTALELCGPQDHMARAGCPRLPRRWRPGARGDLDEAVDAFSEAVRQHGRGR